MKIPRRLTLISIPTIAFLLVQLGITYKTLTGIANHFSSGSLFRYDLLSLLMPVVIAAFVALIMRAGFHVPKSLFLLVVYGVYIIVVTVGSMNYSVSSLVFTIINMVYWIAVLVIAYQYVQKTSKNLDEITWAKRRNTYFMYNACLMFIGLILLVQSYQSAAASARFANRDVLMNSVYYLIFLLPAVLCCRKKWVQYAAFAAALIATVFSSKRTALVLVLVCWAFWVLSTMRQKSLQYKLGMIIAAVILSIIGYNIFIDITSQYGLNLLERMNAAVSGADNGSGRFDIWRDTLEAIGNEDLLTILIGRGYRAVSVNARYSHLSESHNEFLQVLFDYGVCGLLMLIAICISLVRTGFRMRKAQYEFATAYWISLIIFFLSSMVSMTLIYPYWFIGMASFWGFTMADFQRYDKLQAAQWT
ncbi:MAG: O-antigen ligase family protein [Aristaeellaceae bacterium]